MNNYTAPPNYEAMRLLKGEEVASVLNCSRAFAYRLMRQGELPTIKMGRAVRVRFQDLESYIIKMMTQKKSWSVDTE